MWICFNDAFVSAVEDARNPAMLKVRARKREHLRTLFPTALIHESNESDYAFRVIVSKVAFAKLVANRIGEISYGNFKDSVKDDDLHELYAAFWHMHWRYQEMPPKKRHRWARDLFSKRRENQMPPLEPLPLKKRGSRRGKL